MTATRATALLVLLLVAGCSGSSATASTPTSETTRSTTSTTTARTAPTSSATIDTVTGPPVVTTRALPSVMPTVLPEKEQEYLLTAEQVSPQFTSDDLQAVETGYGVCSRTEAEWPDDGVRAWLQLQAPVDLTPDQANQIIAAARGYLCQ